ncbi:MAG: hypothetical protein K5879_03840 [Lachnospiraceae bacterium]|nr:hypothetical protein [Lachnospiraceae bacterium]
MNEFMKYKIDEGDDVIEFEVYEPQYLKEYSDERLAFLEEQGQFFELVEKDLDQQIEELNGKIDNLTNKADGYDYAIAICSGAIAGLVDILFVGEFDFEGAKTSVDEAFGKFVNNRAKDIKIDEALKKAKENYAKKGQPLTKEKIAEIKAGIEKNFKDNPNLASSIKVLEEKFKLPTDNIWSGENIGISTLTHHLDDLAHHPTIIGLAASILTQFTKQGYFQNKEGLPFVLDVKNKELIGKDLKAKLVCGVINWIGHLISDMAGSYSSARRGTPGMGLPGPFVSTLKELSTLPLFKNTNLAEIANYLFTDDNAIFGKFRLDLRSELAIAKELTKQAIPVFVDEVLVRTSFFVRRLLESAKTAQSIKDIPWKEVLPVGNRTVARMVTISLGTMEVVDLTDAAIRGAIEANKAGAAGAEVGAAGGPYGAAAGAATASTVAFWKTFALRVNYVGVGSFAVAGFVDTAMGIQRQKLISERISMYDQKLAVSNAKVCFKEAEMWISAEKAGESIEEAYRMIEVSEKEIDDAVVKILQNLDLIADHVDAAEEKNPGLKESMLKTLKWGI